MHEGRQMKKTQSDKWREEIEAGIQAILLLGTYSDEETIRHYRDLGWDAKKDFVGHSQLKCLHGQVQRDLMKAKAARYDSIAPHYEQLVLFSNLKAELGEGEVEDIPF
jgi:hypothetical protein